MANLMYSVHFYKVYLFPFLHFRYSHLPTNTHILSHKHLWLLGLLSMQSFIWRVDERAERDVEREESSVMSLAFESFPKAYAGELLSIYKKTFPNPSPLRDPVFDFIRK